MDTLRIVAQNRAFTRREFLRNATMAGALSPILGFAPLRAASIPRGQKTVVITFGGGARDEETFAPEGQENIPHLIGEIIPQSTFFTQVVNRGILGHYVATASLATGVYESFDNFADVAPRNPTVFEYFRKGLQCPANDAWVIAPSNGFNRIGQSDGTSIAPGWGARVILPKRLLTTVSGRSAPAAKGSNLQVLLQDNYEDLLFTPPTIHEDAENEKLIEMLNLSADDFVQHAQAVSSADELSVYVMRHLMQQYAPSLLWITLHDMDIAHTGAYSLYLDAIQRTDRLCSQIWKMIEGHPEYKGRTTLLILPDFGRDSDFSPSGNGFQHHRTGDPLSRTTWMIATGPQVRQNVTIDRPLDSLDLVPTLGAMMRFDTPMAKGKPIWEVVG